MCEDAKTLIIGYITALEGCDRVHLMFLAAFRRGDPAATEDYRGLLREQKAKVQAARQLFQDHQAVHKCCEVIHFEDDLGVGARVC